ncbi:hypothetical protein HFO06_29605 [Rhizobium leguminosarum]|uniref:hypothetical protein n=1 Tax=Rhizobium leguminosarum TaxID=384 RepID=UPI001C945045|nr:hypothetical protein [Rhizobium leguminosarum]MBY5767201.1 hypothetical protein [Rhizobium leguminosarum]
MNGDEQYLIDQLNNCLGELAALINAKNQGKRRVQRAIDAYDGDGKLFEALTLFRLKSLFDEEGIRTQICRSDGSPSDSFVLRGSPGELNRAREDDGKLPNPSHIAIDMGDRRIEVHNSVEWPDRLASYGAVHELDISIAETAACDWLSDWYGKNEWLQHRTVREHAPLLGMELKFHRDVSTKALGREMTGLAYTTCPMMFVLGTRREAPYAVRAQVGSLRRLHRRGIKWSACLTLWQEKKHGHDRERPWAASLLPAFLKLWNKRLRSGEEYLEKRDVAVRPTRRKPPPA